MAQSQMNPKELTGFNIYQNKNQTIYWDILTKTAYIITRSDVSKFSTWQLRLPLILMISMILILIGMPLYVGFGALALGYIVTTYLFKFKYLPTLAISTKWQKPKSEGFIKDMAKKFRFSSLVFVTIMFAIFVLMFGLDLYIYRNVGNALVIYGILVVISLIATIISLLITITRKKMDKAEVK